MYSGWGVHNLSVQGDDDVIRVFQISGIRVQPEKKARLAYEKLQPESTKNNLSDQATNQKHKENDEVRPGGHQQTVQVQPTTNNDD
jgi:hypothetical protein